MEPDQLTAQVQELKARCAQAIEQEHDDTRYLDEDQLRRLIVAREGNLDRAYEMWERWVDWRKTYKADQITEVEIGPIYEAGTAFWRGFDKQGRPALIVRARHHWPGRFSLEETMRFIIYMIETGVQKADEHGVGQVCVIYDRGQMTDANKDPHLIETVKTLSGMLQDFYAERLGAMYVLHVGWFYYLMYQAAKHLINRKTRGKLHVMRNVNGLREHFEVEHLMEEYGGTDPYIHPHPTN